ncbi:Sodium-dependent lysophosphatidylcholine symporter 1-A [Larimichthys crocea]|uniref:Uncharacterized protein n=1 Tax=Larimichthys crocea TaxID=215358 RepID=A0ACD3RAQ8_LARCR|nr:Sodium-dependent lysophosphatidylcholine symporter 1-A [Larimichthys crocea]
MQLGWEPTFSTSYWLCWSMLPDVVDDFALKHPSCKDMEPMFFSCYAFCSKLAGGLSVGISTMTLQFVDYRAGACSHGDGVVTALIVLFSPVPIALLLIGMVFFRSYPLNERQSSQLQEQLTTNHPEAASSSSDPKRTTISLSNPAASQRRCGHQLHIITQRLTCCLSQILHRVVTIIIKNAQSSHQQSF